jgi:hypothetical protein
MDVPSGLGERGVALWETLSTGDAPVDALALEAARTADRLDELDNIIQGKGVLNLMQFRMHLNEIDEDGDRNINVEVKFNAVLAEARQQGAALAGLLTKLGQVDGKPAATSKPNEPAAVETPLERMRRLRKA